MRISCRRIIVCCTAALAATLSTAGAVTPPSAADLSRWTAAARDTRIVRDDYGIAHVHGRTDADAVFGMVYAQAEDDFNRVETNYLNALGRLAEAEGESALYSDLRAKLFVSPAQLKSRYAASPGWLRRLMLAWADGLNYYLYTHSGVHPRVLERFEPWMALSFSEGSIGGDIERVTLDGLKSFYGPPQATSAALTEPARRYPREPGGSNGIAIAPRLTANGHALLLINPHTTFYFRSELQMTSDEGLNAYGAVTWGQFFVYQGFNDRLGWMHTSSGVDNVDFFLETIVRRGTHLYYRYGKALRPVTESTITVPYRTTTGMTRRSYTVYRTHHGPIVRQSGERWVAVSLMDRPVEALSQSFLLTKARDYRSYQRVMQLRANSSNNTVYADADGNIAYLHPQFIPRREDRYDYRHPVDGSDPSTDWHGLHALEEAPHLLNPANGWIANTNNWPYSAAGEYSPKATDFPRYMDTYGENPRGVHAQLLLKDHAGFTADSLNAAAYDSYLPAFARLLPALVAAYEALPADDARRASLAQPIAVLRDWDYRWSAGSIATTLASLWGDELWVASKQDADAEDIPVYEQIAERTSSTMKLAVLTSVTERLAQDFGSWQVPWGEFNRLQRVNGDVVQHFSDDAPSQPVPFASARWGSLASFGARRYEGTKRYYGTSGNSFVAIVEFGEHVSARAVSVGGESGDPASAHFADQNERYTQGRLRPVYYYPADLAGHTERSYHP